MAYIGVPPRGYPSVSHVSSTAYEFPDFAKSCKAKGENCKILKTKKLLVARKAKGNANFYFQNSNIEGTY